MTQAERKVLTPAQLAQYRVGSALSRGGFGSDAEHSRSVGRHDRRLKVCAQPGCGQLLDVLRNHQQLPATPRVVVVMMGRGFESPVG
jgi:hypothetical protein